LVAAFFLPLFWVFLAELGDKTQLVALCFAARFPTRVVMAGVFSATLVVHIGSVILGGAADRLMPTAWVRLIAGLAFIGFGIWTIRGDELDDESCRNKQGRSPFWIVATTFFLAELGDKTMLTTVAQAALYPKYAAAVWIGSTLGMVISDGFAIAMGRILGHRLPYKAIKIGAALLFFAFGIFSAVQGAVELNPLAWLIGAIVLLVCIFVLWPKRTQETAPSCVEYIKKDETREEIGLPR
jgi:putative Ca2+/H+ antiporter (TMEM165/GDT1 family)